ncbi:MAG: hypothetical protein ACKVOE_07225 [Rickettsiales bacterium]
MKNVLTLALFLLAACSTAPAAYQPQPYSYGAPLTISALQVKVTDNFSTPLKLPHIEQDFPVLPSTVLKHWADQRLKASGNGGVMEVSINEASAVAVPLAKTKGVEGFFTDDQDTRYNLTLKVNFRIYSGTSGLSDASGDVTVTRSRTINEKATVYDRQKLFDEMLHEAMASFDREAELRLRQYFSGFMK